MARKMPREVRALQGQQPVERLLPRVGVLGHDHFLEDRQLALVEEHVLGAAQADALRPELAGGPGVARQIRVGTDPESARLAGELHAGAHLVGPGEELRQRARDLGLRERRFTQEHLARGAVDRHPVALAEPHRPHAGGLGGDGKRRAAGHARGSHAARHHRGVRGHAPGRGQDALRGDHAADVLRRRLAPHQQRALAAGRPLLGFVGGEHDAPGRGAGGRVEAGGHGLAQLAAPRRIDAGVQELVDLLRLDPLDRLHAGDQPFAHHVHGDRHRRRAGALPGPGLQQVEVAVLDRELQVLHVPVVALQAGAHLFELPVHVGMAPSQRRQRLGRADAGHDVLALRVLEVLAVEHVFARRRIAGEADAGPGVFAGVPEHHRLHVDGGAEQALDVVQLAITDGAVVVP